MSNLRQIAESWTKTPWCADGAVKGTGVSCSRLPHAVLNESGANLPEIPARAGLLKSEIVDICEEWMDESPDFVSVGLDDRSEGNVLLFDVGIGHMALCLDEGQIVQAWQTIGVHITTIDARLERRLKRVWKPVFKL